MTRMQDTSPATPNPPGENRESGRLERAQTWAAARLDLPHVELSPVSGDASFRRYFRVRLDTGSVILMDAPPPQENLAPFIDIDARLLAAGLRAPQILHADLADGFALLEDFGDQLYRGLIDADSVDELFPDLFRVLARMATHAGSAGLPLYDAARLQGELDLYTDWYLLRHRQESLRGPEAKSWQHLCSELIASAAAQPQVFVHRDFHSANLLHQQGLPPGIIDFQDAVKGPLSYDFISLLWDRYIAWPRPQLEQWMEEFRTLVAVDIDPASWVRYCDLMGLQRNLKIVGIFARLHYRDGKTGYLEMIPRFYRYLLDVISRYPEFADCQDLLESHRCAP